MASKTTQALANFIKNIHPPLNMTPREQRIFLDNRIKAFWNQLDAEHGPDKSSSTHTNVHIASVLNNPHFAGPRPKNQPPATDKRRISKPVIQDRAFYAELQSKLARPVSTFREQVAAGEATLSSAVEHMRSYLALDSRIKDGDNRDMSQLVANWIWATGLEDSLEFAHDDAFVKLLVRLLYREGNQARILTWHNKIRLHLNSSGSRSEGEWGLQSTMDSFGTLVLRHIQAEFYTGGLNAALDLFVDLKGVYTRDLHNERGTPAVNKRFDPRTILTPAGSFLLAKLKKKATFTQPLDVPDHTYESFADTVALWSAGAMLDYNTAMLDLNHPTQPSDVRATTLLEKFPLSSLGMERRVALCRFSAEWNLAHQNYSKAATLFNEENKLLAKITDDKKPEPADKMEAVVEWMQQMPSFAKPSKFPS